MFVLLLLLLLAFVVGSVALNPDVIWSVIVANRPCIDVLTSTVIPDFIPRPTLPRGRCVLDRFPPPDLPPDRLVRDDGG